MKKRMYTLALLSILAVSFLFMTPVTVFAEDPELPIGDIDRIEFFDYIGKAIMDNETRFDLTSQLLFGGKLAYVTINTSASISESSIPYEFYGIAYTGVDDGTDKIYLRTNASVIVNSLDFSQDAFINIMLWDNDMSFLNLLNDLNTYMKENNGEALINLLLDVINHPAKYINGDEVFFIIPIFLWQFEYDMTYDIDNQYIIDTNGNGPYDELELGSDVDFSSLSQSIKDDLVQKASEGDPTLTLLMNDSSGTIAGAFSEFFYLIQQIWLKTLWWELKLIPFKFEWDIDIVSVRHLLFRTALYNDSDGNGLMDISFNETANGLYYPYSSEAVCFLQLVNASGINFGEPQIDDVNEEISWNATITNPFVRLNPYGQSAEMGLIADAPVVPMGDSSIGFTFKPQTTGTGRNIDLNGIIKLDHTVGALNGTQGLKGVYEDLDLALIYLSDVFELADSGKITLSEEMEPVVSDGTPQENATAKNDEGDPVSASISATTSATSSLDFFIGSSRVAGLNLTTDKYSIGNEDPTNPTHVAKSAVVPWALWQFAVDQTGEASSQKGSVDWNLSAGVAYSTYFYEICYSDYNGSKLIHDPTYVIYGDVTYPGGIPGFEFSSIFMGLSIIGCIVIFLKKKRMNIKI